jgi:pyridoxamine 5'-phosphate oxidase
MPHAAARGDCAAPYDPRMPGRSPAKVPPAPIGFTPLPMDFEHPPADPVVEFRRWFDEACMLPMPNPNAMTLATVDASGAPSARIVLLRGIDERGALFFTNRQSRKGTALEAVPRAALLFHWDLLDRQIRIEGRVTHATEAESDGYHAARPRESQIGAWASDQSRPVASRAAFEARIAETEARFAGGPVPRPPHWGGYRVSLDSIEFWQGHPYRLHDRIVYAARAGGWSTTRLFP